MDSNKVIVMEVKDDYAIVMTSDFEFIKVKKKKSIKEGQQIYILDEDICQGKEKISFFKKDKLLKILGLLAILFGILMLALLFNPFKRDTYATVYLEGNSNVELNLDDNTKVIKAISEDNSIPNSELKGLKNKSFEQAIDNIDDYLENDNYIIASCYIPIEENSNYLDHFKSIVNEELSDVIFIYANKNDLKQAKEQNKTLVQYKIQNLTSLSELEKYVLDDIDYDKIDQFVAANINLIKNSEQIREEIKNKKLDDKDEEDNDEEDDDSDEKDESDDD